MSSRQKNKKRRSRVRQKQPPIVAAGVNLAPQNWHDHLPELLYIICALENSNAQHVVDLLIELRRHIPDFTGRVSELGNHLQADPNRLQAIKAELEQLFGGSNASLLRRFSVPSADILRRGLSLPDAIEEEDYLELVRVVTKVSEPRSPRSTRAKLVHLLVIQPGLVGIRSFISMVQLEQVLSGDTDDIEQGIASQIRAAWLAFQVQLPQSGEWSRVFWEEALEKTPCVKQPERTATDTITIDSELTVMIAEMDRLWRELVALEMQYPIYCVAEVTFGLMCRVWRLTHDIVDLSILGKGEVAEMAVRCHFESAVTLLWLLKQGDAGLFQRFKDYAVGKDKAQLEYVQTMKEGTPELRNSMKQVLKADIASTGTPSFLVPEEKGAWIDVSIRDMADGMDPLYVIVFGKTSDIVHGSWRDLTRYHLTRCLNPLHAGHWIPYTGPSHDAGVTPIIYALLLAADSLVQVAATVGAGGLEAAGKNLGNSVRKRALTNAVSMSSDAQ